MLNGNERNDGQIQYACLRRLLVPCALSDVDVHDVSLGSNYIAYT